MKNRFAIACLCGVLACAGAQGSTTATWEMNSYRDFAAGRLSGVSLSRDGSLTLAPKIETLFSSDQPIIWSVVQAPDGTIYAGTGHRGRVFRIDPSGTSSVYWTADQPEVFALALDRGGALYAATSPDGKIYRIENGKAQEYFAPQAKYIWSLAVAPDGTLFAGTGDQGKVFHILGQGKGEVFYETGQMHVTSLALDSQGRLLAGTEPNGMLYRIEAKDKAFVLYDSAMPEIRSIVPASDGAIYVAALGGSMARRSYGGVQSGVGVPSSVSVGSSSATVTVEASTQSGVEIKPKADAAKPAQPAAAAPAVAAVVDVGGVDKSAIYRIDRDNTVETLWTSKEENVYDLLSSGGQLVFSTDGQGRIYRLSPDRKLALITETNEGEAVRLLSTARGIVAATGDMGKLYRLVDERTASGSYESPVHDASTVARWGRLSWRADVPAGAKLQFRTRSGNSVRPDKTWSEWSAPLADSNGSPIPSPNARYLQWKGELTGAAQGAPVIDSVTAAYLPQNTPPVLRSISVNTAPAPAAAAAAKTAASAQSSTAAYTVTVTDTADAAPSTSSGTPTQSAGRLPAGQLLITWQAEDPDGDRLTYSLYFRGESEREWKLLKANLTDATYSIDDDSLADGKYFFRVVASDGLSNTPDVARTAELVSSPTLIDNTPPVVTLGAPKRSGEHVELDFEAADSASDLRRCEYSLDAAPWIPIAPEDGILDSQRERFSLKLDHVPAGEHLLVIRAIDAAGNAGLAKVVIR